MGVGKNQHFAGLGANAVVQRILDAAQSLFVHVHVAQHMRRKLALGIKAPAFALKINSAKIHGRDSIGFFRWNLPGNPCEGVRTGDARGDFVRRNFQHLPQKPRHHVRIGNFGGHSERRIHRHAHRQRIHVAVKNFRAARSYIDNQSLLVLRAGIIFAVAEQLQVGQPSEHRSGPQQGEGRYDRDPGPGTSQIHNFAGKSVPGQPWGAGTSVWPGGSGSPFKLFLPFAHSDGLRKIPKWIGFANGQSPAADCVSAARSLLLRRARSAGRPCLGQHRVRRQIHRRNLRRNRSRESKLAARDHVNAFRRAQSRHFQFQFLVQFAGLGALAAQRFQLVAQLNRLKVLPGVKESAQRDQRAERN